MLLLFPSITGAGHLVDEVLWAKGILLEWRAVRRPLAIRCTQNRVRCVKLHGDYAFCMPQKHANAVLTNFNVLVLVVEDVVAVIGVRVGVGRGVEAGRVERGHGCGPLHIRPGRQEHVL